MWDDRIAITSGIAREKPPQSRPRTSGAIVLMRTPRIEHPGASLTQPCGLGNAARRDHPAVAFVRDMIRQSEEHVRLGAIASRRPDSFSHCGKRQRGISTFVRQVTAQCLGRVIRKH